MDSNIFQEYFMREGKPSIVLSIGLVYCKAFFTALHMGHWNSTGHHQGALELCLFRHTEGTCWFEGCN